MRDALKSGEHEKVAAAVREIRSDLESEQGSWTRDTNGLYKSALHMLATEVPLSQDSDVSSTRTSSPMLYRAAGVRPPMMLPEQRRAEAPEIDISLGDVVRFREDRFGSGVCSPHS